MNTPTDEEIVAHIAALADPNTKPTDVELMKAVAREALRLAREGLPVKDEAEELANRVSQTLDGVCTQDEYDRTLAIIRTFLAARDAERDAEVKELVKAASYARICLKNGGYHNEWTRNLDAVLAKMERKP